MKRRHLSLFALGAVASLLALPAARADILVSNLDQPLRDSSPIAQLEYWGAQSFATAGVAVDLASIAAIVGNGANSPLVVAELRLSTGPLHEIDTSPAGLVTTFTAPDVSGALAPRVFTPDTPVTLDANTSYWFLLGSSNGGTYDWSYADTNLFSGPGTLGNYADSSDGGATWILRGNDFPYFIEVNTSATIPEPASGGLAGVMLTGWLVTRRRRRG
jgi:hypothetical protein